MWRIEDFEKVEVPAEKHGQFYGGDSYVVLYTYMEGSKECHMIYFWQGKESSNDEKGASALQAKNLDDELGGVATQCRVVHGKEPSHFRFLFKGGMIVHDGGKASGFKNVADGDSFDLDRPMASHDLAAPSAPAASSLPTSLSMLLPNSSQRDVRFLPSCCPIPFAGAATGVAELAMRASRTRPR